MSLKQLRAALEILEINSLKSNLFRKGDSHNLRQYRLS